MNKEKFFKYRCEGAKTKLNKNSCNENREEFVNELKWAASKSEAATNGKERFIFSVGGTCNAYSELFELSDRDAFTDAHTACSLYSQIAQEVPTNF